MIGKRTLAAGTVTVTAVAALGGVAVGAWGPQPKPPELVAEAPLVITDVRTIRKTVHVKPKPRPVTRHVQAAASSPAAYVTSSSSAAGDQSPSYAAARSNAAPTVSTHSSGGGHSAEREHEDGERPERGEDHEEEED